MPVFVVNAQYGISETIDQTPLTDFKSISLQTMAGNLLGGVLSLVGIVFFALMVYGGATWMISAGNQEKEKKAIGTIVSAIVGIVIVLSAYVLVSFVFDSSKVTGSGGSTAPQKVTTPTIENTAPPSDPCKDKTGSVKGCDTCTATHAGNTCMDKAECKTDTIKDGLCRAPSQGNNIKCCEPK